MPARDHSAGSDGVPAAGANMQSTTAPCAGLLIRAETFVHRWETFSRPAEFRCSDGNSYVLKALCHDRAIGRAIYNDQVIARLGRLLAAPVGEVELVQLDSELIALNPQLSYMLPGICHATRRIPDVSERIDNINHADEPGNRSRFSALALLYGWVGTIGDRQFVYANAPPHLVHSVDHGHFFPGGPDWTPASLTGAPACAPDDTLVAACRLSRADLAASFSRLQAVTPAMIDEIVARPPTAWGVPDTDRAALRDYLAQRQSVLAGM